MQKVNVLITVPQPLRDIILTEKALAKLRSFANVTMNEDGHDWTGDELKAKLPGMDAVITGWGIVKLSSDVLANADKLRLVAHSAGSVKGFITDTVYDKGVAVTHSAGRIADSVAEYTLLSAMVGLRKPHEYDRRMKAGEQWPASRGLPLYEIAGKKVGLLGMGYVGRRTAQLFKAVGAEVWAFDPYLSEEQAKELGVHKAGLHEILKTCPIVSDHLPVTDETHHMLGAKEFAMLQDGAIFVNSARSWTYDEQALIKELASGRFWAAVDVFDKEPMALDHPMRKLDNVMITPHMAGITIDSLQDLVATVIDETERFFAGQPMKYQVTRDMLSRMA
jgi:phosphoglycerate dehydrogenase-like enzyme